MTRRLACFALVVAFALLLDGCGPVASFFPLYNSDDKVFESGLVGIWKLAEPDPNNPDEKNERWAFEKAGDEISYNLKLGAVATNGGMLVKVRLAKIGSGLFADFEGDTGNEALESKDAVIAFPVMDTHIWGEYGFKKTV